MPIFISTSTQDKMFLYFHNLFVIALFMNVVFLVFLIKITPPKQAVIRKYLILIQANLILQDVTFDVGLCPIFLFPAPAGYALGLLMKIGVSAHHGFSLVLLFYVWVGSAVVICIMFRYQTLLPQQSILRVDKRLLRFLTVVVVSVISVFYIIYAFNGNDAALVEIFLDKDTHNLTWIRERGTSYYITERTTTLRNGILTGVSIMINAAFGNVQMFVFMWCILQRDRTKRSAQSLQLIRRSVLNLFFQLVVPLIFLYIPASVVLLGVAFENFLSFETSFVLFHLFPWHSIFHNAILLTITTAYRKQIVFLIRKLLPFRQTSIQVLPRN